MIEPFNVDGGPPPVGPYSHGVLCSGTMIFLAGQIALRADGTMVGGSVADQTEQVMYNIRTVLAGKGLTLKNVVKATVFLKDLNDFAEMNAVYATHFGDHKPARSAVEVSRLPKDAHVEIEVIACMP